MGRPGCGHTPPAASISVVIPARNEQLHLAATVAAIHGALISAGVQHELVVVDDHSTDSTWELLSHLRSSVPTLRPLRNEYGAGYGFAVRYGLDHFAGDAVAIMMADGADDPHDLIRFISTLNEGYDCVFGSRFTGTTRTHGYPVVKLVANRIGNWLIRTAVHSSYDDITNAFKLFRRTVIAGIQPLSSTDFSLCVELPVRTILAGYSYAVLPNRWTNKRRDSSRFRLSSMSRAYFRALRSCLAARAALAAQRQHGELSSIAYDYAPPSSDVLGH